MRTAFAKTRKTLKKGFKKLGDAVLKRLFPKYFQHLLRSRAGAKQF